MSVPHLFYIRSGLMQKGENIVNETVGKAPHVETQWESDGIIKRCVGKSAGLAVIRGTTSKLLNLSGSPFPCLSCERAGLGSISALT